MPQSQTAANHRQQEEEKKDKNITLKTNKQIYEKHKDQLFPKRPDKTNGETRTKSRRRLQNIKRPVV